MLRAELLFGLARPGSDLITQVEFTAFLDRSVTPRFPDGLTVLDGAGRWRTPDGRMTSEPSKVVLIVAAPGPGSVEKLEAIRTEYRTQFRQQSVGVLLTQACGSF